MATNKKGYFNKFRGWYLYVVKDLNGKIVYIGRTQNYYRRLSNHKAKCVKSTRDFIRQGNYTIQYLKLEGMVRNLEELRYLENVLIELYEPRLNDLTNIIRNVDKFRMLELCNYIHSFNADWITYCTIVNGLDELKKTEKNVYVNQLEVS